MLDSNHKFLGIVSNDSLRELIDQPEKPQLIASAYIDNVVPAHINDSMQDILPEVASHPWALPILNDDGKYMGAVSKNLFLRTLHRAEAEESTGLIA